jgi:hypothetical protein
MAIYGYVFFNFFSCDNFVNWHDNEPSKKCNDIGGLFLFCFWLIQA